MDIEVQRTTEALDQGDRAGTGSCMVMACFFNQVRRNHAVDDAQHPAHDFGPAGKQETQLQRETQHPLAQSLPRERSECFEYGLLGQHIFDQQGCALGHAPRPATRIKTPTSATEGNQVLGVADSRADSCPAPQNER